MADRHGAGCGGPPAAAPAAPAPPVVPVEVACVGAVVHDRDGRLLLIRRGRPPAAGRWSLPGGRVEPGEAEPAAVRREVAEETGLQVAVGPLVGRVRRDGPPGVVYAIADYAARVVAGTLAAGDDAIDARWCTAAELAELPLTAGLLDALAGWGRLPAGPPTAAPEGAPLSSPGPGPPPPAAR